MDVVYVCRDGENEELRYSLRSLENIEHGDVWIFGGKPNWVTNVNFVPVKQEPRTNASKNRNTTMLLSTAVDTVPGDFILMNDDFYIIKKLGKLPLYDRGLSEDLIKDYTTRFKRGSIYIDGMKKTHQYLIANGYNNPLSYELHAPMPVRKDIMRDALTACAEIDSVAPHKRTLYGNFLGEPSETIADVKITKFNFDRIGSVPDTPFLSTSDNASKLIIQTLKYFFRKPSIYEE